MDFLPQYKPRNYTYSAGGTIPNQGLAFDREAFVQACLQSERTSVTIDLSSEKKIREFAEQVEHFHPMLQSAVVRWVNDPDKEHVRDCIHLPGTPPVTASQQMHSRSYTFMDVIAEAQRENMKKLEAGDNTPVANVTFSEPWHTGVSAQPQAHKPKMGRFGRFINWVSRGAYEKYQGNKEKQAMQNILDRKPPEEVQGDLLAHNAEVLKMEQVLHDDREHLAEIDRAAGLLAQHGADLAQQVQRDDSLRNAALHRIDDADLKLRRLDELDAGAKTLNGAMRVLGEVSAIRREHGDDADQFDIIQINRLNDHRPPSLEQGQTVFLNGKINETAEAYGKFITFRKLSQLFEGKTNEEIDSLVKQDLAAKQSGNNTITSLSDWKEAVELLKNTPREQWAAKQAELKNTYIETANVYFDNFRDFCEKSPMQPEIQAGSAEKRQAERAGLLEQKAAENHRIQIGDYPEAAASGADFSKQAQMLRKIELEETERMSKQLEQDREVFAREAAEREKCSDSFKRSTGTYEPTTLMFDVPGFGRPETQMSQTSAQILEANRAQAAPNRAELDRTQMQALAAQRDRYETAQREQHRIDGYSDYDTFENMLGDMYEIENQDSGMVALSEEQRADVSRRYYSKVAEIASFAKNSPNIAWNMLSDEEAAVTQKDLQTLQSYADPQASTGMRVGDESVRMGTLHNVIVAIRGRDHGLTDYLNNPEQIAAQTASELAESKAAYENGIETHRAAFSGSVLSSVATRAAAQNAHSAPVRERVSQAELGQPQTRARAATLDERTREQPARGLQHSASSKQL